MPADKRLRAAEAFWRDRESPDIQVQQMEVVATLARRMNFRAKSVQALPLARKARHLAELPDVSEAVAMRALVAYHFAEQRALMAAFLDALGIPHEQGLITAEDVESPDSVRLAAAIETLRQTGNFSAEDITFYLRTLASLDADTWTNVDAVLQSSAS